LYTISEDQTVKEWNIEKLSELESCSASSNKSFLRKKKNKKNKKKRPARKMNEDNN